MSAAAPLLTRMDARRTVPAPSEFREHVSLVDCLNRFARHDVRWTHPAGGELRDKRTAAKLKAMGVSAGWPDLILLVPGLGFAALELKRYRSPLRRSPDCDLSPAQIAFRDYCRIHGFEHAVAYGLREAVDVLTGWGVWRTVPVVTGGRP